MADFLINTIAQKKTAEILDRIILSKKIPHAFLFKGPEGVGKEYIAIQFAKRIADYFIEENNKQNIISNIEKFNEPYIKYIFPLPRGKNENDSSGPFEKLTTDDLDIIREQLKIKSTNPFYKISIPKANLIKVNSIRDIKKFLSASFDDIKYRVIIISDAHLMNEESQNSLLKNLEEPPKGVIFILSTAFPERLRETIRSRCWTINFPPLSNSEVIGILKEYFNYSSEECEKVVPFSFGSVSSALELLDNDFEILRERTIKILRYSFARRFQSAFSEFSEITENQDQVQLRLIIKMIITWLNDIHRYKNNLGNYFFSEHLDTLKKFTEKFPDIILDEITHKIDLIGNLLKNNININLAVGSIVTELSSIIPQK